MGLRESINIRRLNKGDAEAFAQLFDWYGDKLFGHVYYRVSNRELAQDITSQTFLKVWEYVIRLQDRQDKSVKPIENARAFLYRTANNLVIDYYRTKKHQAVELTEQMHEVIADDTNIAETVSRRFEVAYVKESLGTFKDVDQQLVLLRYIDDLTIKEICEITDLNENTVSVRLHRALNKLKARLRQDKKNSTL